MADKKFIDGMRYAPPRDKAPKWILGSIAVEVTKFIEFAQANANNRGWLNIDIKEGRNGKTYLELNEYDPSKKAEPFTPEYRQVYGEEEVPVIDVQERLDGSIKPEDLPF